MFPNPQDALPQPPHANLEQYRKLAKDLVKACRADSPDSLRNWTTAFVHDLVQRSGIEITPTLPFDIDRRIHQVTRFAEKTLRGGDRPCVLTSAQFVLAQSLGFVSWPRLVKHLEEMAIQTSGTSDFEAAADAIIRGDLASLQSLVARNPGLIRQRSSREHRATLLHYTAANGVEGYRQKTPPNIVDITRFLLQSGAEIDAEADVYGGGCTTLGLAATSIHPQLAGVQEPLLQLLLDHGARIEKPNLAGNGHGAILACLVNGQPKAAVFLAARGATLNLDTAAGAGRLDFVQSCFASDGALIPPATKRQVQSGFLWACTYGHEDVAIFLLDHGADLRDRAHTGATGLHWAAGSAHAAIVKRLIALGSPLEDVNQWGGTVLEHAGHGFAHDMSGTDFIPTFQAILEAGAKIRRDWLQWIDNLQNRSPRDKARATELFRRYGATT